jgi:hypothetical protein
MCVTVTVVTGHSVALNRRSHLFSTMSSLHDVLVHDIFKRGGQKALTPLQAAAVTCMHPFVNNFVVECINKSLEVLQK